MPLMTVRSSRQTMGMRMPWRCRVRARLRAYWIQRPEFTRQRSFTATSAGLRQRRKASLPTSLSGIRAASASMSSDCNSLVTRPGVLLKSKSLVARLKTMLSALRCSSSSALVRETGTCVAPMREATRWRWWPERISPSESAKIGAMKPSFRSDSSIRSRRSGTADLGL